MATDFHFDQITARFSKNIYADTKGKLRLTLLEEDLHSLAQSAPLRILDAGGGLGQMARWFARQGHQVRLCDASAPMLQKAEEQILAENLQDRIQIKHCPIQELLAKSDETYDLILCHALIEWLGDPQSVVTSLIERLKPGGHLSLLFYNRHAIVMRNAVFGNFRKIRSGQFAGDGTGLTPTNPQIPQDVFGWLSETGLETQQLTGIRVFYDFLTRKSKEAISYEDVLELEREYCRQDPYRQMARYIHVLCRKPD